MSNLPENTTEKKLGTHSFEYDHMRAMIAAVLTENKEVKTEIPWWLKAFGGTLLVIVSTICLGVIQHFHSKINDLDTSMHTNMEKFVRMDDFNIRHTSQWNSIKELQANTPKVLAHEEKLKALETQLSKAEADIKALTVENAKLRERVAALGKKPGDKSEDKQ